jgi:hypothetical protein
MGWNAGAVELECVADQVLENLTQLDAVAEHDRQIADFDRRRGVGDARLEVEHDLARHIGEVVRDEREERILDALACFRGLVLNLHRLYSSLVAGADSDRPVPVRSQIPATSCACAMIRSVARAWAGSTGGVAPSRIVAAAPS